MKEQITRLLQQWHLPEWLWNVLLISAAIFIGILIRFLLSLFLRKKAVESGNYSLFQSIIRHLGTPFSYLIPLILFGLVLPVLRFPSSLIGLLDKAVEIALIILFAWVLVRIINIVQDYILHRFDITKANNLHERKVRTQLQFIRRLVSSFIILLTIAAILLSFETMRKIGAGLLTGVGIGGIIIGFAAQRSLGNLLAGFQIAFTQPIRIDDAVLVENEFGNIEEITLTYVVVRLWDERRLILPINYFIEKPFQNWTRTSSQLLGTVLLYADYTIPVEDIRTELKRLLQQNPIWDKRVAALQVTNATEKVIELRALMSAANSGKLFDLRCQVREALLHYITTYHVEHFPLNRTVLNPGDNGPTKKEIPV